MDVAGGQTPLVGRRAELALVEAHVSAGVVLVLVTGEAGIGKSTLVDALVASWRSQDRRVVRSVAGRAERAERRFGLWSQAAFRLGIQLPDRDDSVGVAEQEWELAAQLESALRAAAPCVVVAEDLHRADASSLAVLEELARDLAGAGVSVVGTVRPEEVRAGSPLHDIANRSVAVALAGLSGTEVGELMTAVRGIAPDAGEVRSFVRRTGGNPLLIHELAQLPTDSPAGDAALDVLVATIERFGPQVADALGALAVAGPERGAQLLAGLVGVDPGVARQLLEAARRGGVLSMSRQASPWFRHELLAEAAAHRLGAQRCLELHRDVAQALGPAVGAAGLVRCRHLIAAVPLIDPRSVLEEVDVVAARLLTMRRAGDAADLLATAIAACRSTAPDDADDAGRWLALGEAHWLAGDERAALDAFRVAGERVDSEDIALVVAIAVAQQRRLSLVMPNPELRARFAALDAALPTKDSTLRVALLGRRAVLALQPPADPDGAARLADEAVGMARRIGRPEVILGALSDQQFVGAAFRGRRRDFSAPAAEVIRLAAAAGRPELAIAGFEWSYAAHVERGDLAAATRVVDELDAFAAISPSPLWALSGAMRRTALHAFGGNRTAALRTIEDVRRWADRALDDELELVGVELDMRNPLIVLFGHEDVEFDRCVERLRPLIDDIPSPYLQVRLAAYDVNRGLHDEAMRRAGRWLREPDSAFTGPTPMLTLGFMSRLVIELELHDGVAALTDVLLPFRGTVAADLRGAELPVDHYLAGLALVAGQVRSAIELSRDSIELARRMPSPPLEAHCLARLAHGLERDDRRDEASIALTAARRVAARCGVLLPGEPVGRLPTDVRSEEPAGAGATRVGPSVRHATRLLLGRAPGGWRIEAPDGTAPLPGLAGLEALAALLAVPHREVAAVDLVGFEGHPPAADLGPMLDARAKREYRRRLLAVQEQIERADLRGDHGASRLAHAERDAVLGELRRASGIAGRDRPQGSGAERARVNVTRNLRRAVQAISNVSPMAGAHLATSLRTGHMCCYAPDPFSPIRWELRLGPRPSAG